ncbi:MAG: hypothetical protein ACI4XG_23590 [Bradyrhizobium sp.]
MATSYTPAKKIPLLSFIGFLQYGFVAAMDASRAASHYPIREPAIFGRYVAMKMPATLFCRYRRKVVAIAAAVFDMPQTRPAGGKPVALPRNFIAPEHAASSLQIAP